MHAGLAPVLLSKVRQESAEAWRQFLEKGLLKEALEASTTDQQKALIARFYADELFDREKWAQAADVYAESDTKFEEVALLQLLFFLL